MTITERRYERHVMVAPATIKAGGHTLAATTRDVSLGGLSIVTDAALREGTDIEVVLMLPKELGLSASEMVCCHGRLCAPKPLKGSTASRPKLSGFRRCSKGIELRQKFVGCTHTNRRNSYEPIFGVVAAIGNGAAFHKGREFAALAGGSFRSSTRPAAKPSCSASASEGTHICERCSSTVLGPQCYASNEKVQQSAPG